MTIGVVIHCDSFLAGHGPGVQTILTSRVPGAIKTEVAKEANIGKMLNIGTWR